MNLQQGNKDQKCRGGVSRQATARNRLACKGLTEVRTEPRSEGGRGVRQGDIKYREQHKSMSNLSEE